MTTDNELVERLESHMGQQDVAVLIHDCRQAAARIRELEAERDGISTDLAELRIIHRDLCGSHDTLNANAVRRLDALNATEARCRKLEEALRKAEADIDAIANRLDAFAKVDTRALLDQADGEKSDA